MKQLYALPLLIAASTVNATAIDNGSFETGDFSGWTTKDIAEPFFALQVVTAGVTPPGFGFFESAPTDGQYAAVHGFDGAGPGTIRVSQDITVDGASTIYFDYRAAWDLQSFCDAPCLDRIFDVNIEQAGGGSELANFNILNATANTMVLDTGNLEGSVDLSAFKGQTVSLNFDWYVPQLFSGPAYFQIDNIRSVAEPSSLALIGVALAGLAFVGRRKAL